MSLSLKKENYEDLEKLMNSISRVEIPHSSLNNIIREKVDLKAIFSFKFHHKRGSLFIHLTTFIIYHFLWWIIKVTNRIVSISNVYVISGPLHCAHTLQKKVVLKDTLE